MTNPAAVRQRMPPLHPNKVKANGKLRSTGETIAIVKWYPQCNHEPINILFLNSRNSEAQSCRIYKKHIQNPWFVLYFARCIKLRKSVQDSLRNKSDHNNDLMIKRLCYVRRGVREKKRTLKQNLIKPNCKNN